MTFRNGRARRLTAYRPAGAGPSVRFLPLPDLLLPLPLPLAAREVLVLQRT